MRHYYTTLLFSLIMAGTSYAATIHVPGDYPTIQGAISASANGDDILVAPGTYTGAGFWVINPLGKAITIRATGSAQSTILDGENVRNVLRCASGEGPDTIIKGFTITGGYTNSSVTGGGVLCNNSSPTITACIITGNTAEYFGGGIYCYQNGNPMITDCVIDSNTASIDGAGIACYYSSHAQITDCTIRNNTATEDGGGIFCYSSNPTISECTIKDNTAVNGAGVGGVLSSPTIINCVIKSNTALDYGGGINGNASPPTLIGTTVCGNVPDQIFGSWTDNGGNVVAQDCLTGACCDGDQCELLNEADCDITYPGGTWLGWGSTCDDCLNPDQGACCLADELRILGCVLTDPSTCFQLGGDWMGSGTDCAACLPPPQPGACCTPTGCTLLWEDVCLSLGGQWLGDDVDCDQCPQAAACCLCDGCLLTWEQECLDAGGDWLSNAGCDECPPPIDVGPCCLASGCIMNASEDDCVSNMGEWLGPNGDCVDCPQPCAGDLNGDWIVDINDLLILLGHYGPCP